MIKISKDINIIPSSLNRRTTRLKREEIINNAGYIDTAIYNSRYKNDDVKVALKKIYHNKCAFCEQRIEQSHIEHYRPKKIYYWLAFSWDNLLIACPICNQNKSTHFEIKGTPVKYANSNFNSSNLHNSSATYDLIELPSMINPEVAEPLNKLIFQKNGSIESNDSDFEYTINTCKLNRDDLIDQRRKLLNDFKQDILAVLTENDNVEDQKVGICTIVSKFIRESEDLDSQFLAFRKFAISSKWINEAIEELIQ